MCVCHTHWQCKGVDRELYELTISKMENSTTIRHMEDTLNRLMSTASKTSTSIRLAQVFNSWAVRILFTIRACNILSSLCILVLRHSTLCVCVFSGNLSRIKGWVRRLTVWAMGCPSCLSCGPRYSCSQASSYPKSSAPQTYSDGWHLLLLTLDSNMETLWAVFWFLAFSCLCVYVFLTDSFSKVTNFNYALLCICICYKTLLILM